MGTYLFYAPEMFEKATKEVTVRGEMTDIWALGITLYFMLTGSYPFGKPDNLLELRRIITTAEFNYSKIMNESAKELL